MPTRNIGLQAFSIMDARFVFKFLTKKKLTIEGPVAGRRAGVESRFGSRMLVYISPILGHWIDAEMQEGWIDFPTHLCSYHAVNSLTQPIPHGCTLGFPAYVVS